MAKYASIKRRPKTEAKPSPGTLAHNQRLAKNIDLLPEEHRLPNYHLNKLSNVTKVFKEWEADNEERYHQINGRKLRSDAHRLESLAIILSEEQVGKCNPDSIWENAHKFKVWFERRYKTTVRTMDWHRDEGYIDDEGNVVRNEHIHLEFDNVNLEGKMVRKLFSKGDLIGFQDKIAEIYKPLGFIRGEDTAKKNRSDKPKIGKPQKDWKKKKIIEAKAKKEPLAKLKDVQAINKELRAELQRLKANREHYAKLEEEIRLLKKQAKAKELTTEELRKREEKLKADYQALEKLAYTTEEHWTGEEGNLTETVKVSYKELYQRATSDSVKERYAYLENKMDEYGSQVIRLEEQLRNKEFEIGWQKRELEEKERENTALRSQNEQLKAKTTTLPASDTLEELKTLKNAYMKLQEENNKLYDEAYEVETLEIDPGINHTVALSYKDRYLSSTKDLNTLTTELEEKKEEIEILEEGYSKIEETVFGKDEHRSVEDIVDGVNTMATILSNVSAYLKIGMRKLVKLFSDQVPEKKELEKTQTNKIEPILQKENNSFSGNKPMKP